MNEGIIQKINQYYQSMLHQFYRQDYCLTHNKNLGILLDSIHIQHLHHTGDHLLVDMSFTVAEGNVSEKMVLKCSDDTTYFIDKKTGKEIPSHIYLRHLGIMDDFKELTEWFETIELYQKGTQLTT